MTQETITAVATAPGRGGIGIIRLSGPAAVDLTTQLTGLKQLTPRYAKFGKFYADENYQDSHLLDEGLLLYFPAPHSFTGEDVVELQTHGSPVALDSILQELVRFGARLARPGEFSERAFLNDKMDLTQAEAIADLIDANTSAAARAAVQSLQGAFSEAITSLNDKIINLRMYVEAAIDFPDEEDVDFIAEGDVVSKIDAIKTQLESITQNAQQGQLLRDGLTIVLAGQPNAGKSSLLNQLSGEDTAIVTDIAGTTRDVLREVISIDGLPINIIDTAGLRDSDDPIEAEGIRRAKLAIAQADHVLYLVDSQQGLQAREQQLIAELGDLSMRTIVWNKVDLISDTEPFNDPSIDGLAAHQLSLSAKSGHGIDALKQHLKQLAGFRESDSGQYLARRRHLLAIATATDYITTASQVLLDQHAGELAAEDLRMAHRSLGEITGEFSADDLLGVIFSSFCIGK